MNKKSFVCKRCGECCKNLGVKLSRQEIERIRDKEGNDDFLDIDPVKRKGEREFVKLVDNDCFFLSENDGVFFCKIYDVRPEVCRKYPFFGKRLKDCKPRFVKDMVGKKKEKIK